MATTKKKEFKGFDELKKENSSSTQYKPQEFLDCGEAFEKVTGLKGPALGHINMLLGHSNTGKTTCLIQSAIACQKIGTLPIFLITEQKWDFTHLKLMGFDCDINPETNEWDGFFFFKNDFQWIEQVTDYMNEVLDKQAKGKIPYNICFFWDSVGSIPCQMSYDGKGGKQHTAGVLQDKIGMGLNQRITGSRSLSQTYTNTLVVVNQPWVERPASPMGQPKIKPKGGTAIYLNATLVFLFGNEAAAGVSKFDATLNGRKIAWGSRTKIGVDKNHVNGLGFKDGQIVVTPHGFIMNDKTEIDNYKRDNKAYWSLLFGTTEIDGMIIDADGTVIEEDVSYED